MKNNTATKIQTATVKTSEVHPKVDTKGAQKTSNTVGVKQPTPAVHTEGGRIKSSSRKSGSLSAEIKRPPSGLKAVAFVKRSL